MVYFGCSKRRGNRTEEPGPSEMLAIAMQFAGTTFEAINTASFCDALREVAEGHCLPAKAASL